MLHQSNRHFFPQGFDAPFYVEDLFPWELLDRMQTAFQHQHKAILSLVPDGVYLEHKETIFIDEGCVLEPGVFIRGPCYLGKNVLVRHGAYLRGNVWVAEGSLIGHASELKNVLVGKNTSLAHFVYAADSVIGAHVNLASHVTLANVRLDEKNILPMQKNKFGAVIGDHCKIGCHVILNPGKQIEPYSKLYVQQQIVSY